MSKYELGSEGEEADLTDDEWESIWESIWKEFYDNLVDFLKRSRERRLGVSAKSPRLVNVFEEFSEV